MSEPARVLVATEGPTDKIILEAVLPRILGREVVLTSLQPTDESLAFGQGGPAGFGWHGVLGWCDEVRRAGGLRALGALLNAEFLVVHLDGDVAREQEISLACPCPPAEATADALRGLLMQRLGMEAPDPRIVLCVPMDATEAWLVAMLRGEPITECDPKPENRFKGGRPKLLEQAGKKKTPEYRNQKPQMAAGWPRALALSQAARFEREVLAARDAHQAAQREPTP
jgi:hypothetical protein